MKNYSVLYLLLNHIGSDAKNIGPLVRIKEDQIELNKEPDKTKFDERKRVSTALNTEITPLSNTEVMREQHPRPQTRENLRSPKKFLIKKKKRRLQSGFKNPKKWDERFYLADGKFRANDPISKLYSRSKSNRVLTAKTRKDYYSKVDKEINGIPNLKAKKNSKILKETRWNERFNVAISKNNMNVHSDYKEFFDKPIDYDVRGYNYTMRPKAMMVYEDEKGRPDIINPRFNERKK